MRIASVLLIVLVGRAAAEPPHHVGEQPWGVANPGPASASPANVDLPPKLVEKHVDITVDPGADRRRIALWTALGGASFVVASASLSLYEKAQYDAAVGANGLAGTVAQRDAANHAAAVARWGATPLFLVGAAAIGTSVYLYASAPRGERVHKTIWVPTVGADHVGVAVDGRF